MRAFLNRGFCWAIAAGLGPLFLPAQEPAPAAPFGPVNHNPALPADTNVVQNQSTTLPSEFGGSPPLIYQWFFDAGGGPETIQGATNSSHRIERMSILDAGRYFVRVTGALGTLDSRSAIVGFTGDDYPPTPLEARWLTDHSIIVRFDEEIDASANGGAIDPFAYSVEQNGGPSWTVGVVYPADDRTAVVLTNLHEGPTPAVRNPVGEYAVRIEGGYVADLAGNLLEEVTYLNLASPVAVLDWDSYWRFDQTGTDRGGEWIAPDYNDESWSIGQGVLGEDAGYAERGLPPILTDLQAPSEGGPITIYFRAKFFLPPGSEVVDLDLAHVRDDGVVVYLNGQEAYRAGVPPGQNSFTLAASHEALQIDGPIQLTNFVAGENTIAVELHNATATSSDAVWGAQLRAFVYRIERHPVIVDQPDDQFVLEGGTAVFQVVASGGLPIQYQWQHNMVNLPGQTNPVLIISNALPPDNGLYRVIVTYGGQSAVSHPALLTVHGDPFRPQLLKAAGSRDLGAVRLSFDEPIDPASAQIPGHYEVRLRGGGAPLGITSATLTNDTNVVLITGAPRLAGTDYEVVVSDVTDTSYGKNVIYPNPTTARVLATESLVRIDDLQLWRYDQADLPPGTAWAEAAFNDEGWAQGAALLAVENTPLPFPIRTELALARTNSPSTQITTYYFRTRFHFPPHRAAVDLLLTPVVDDGAVFYLNGTEIFRLGITNNPVEHHHLAARVVGDAALEGPFNLPADGLLPGENILAVEVHQAFLTSSDVVAGVELDALIETYAQPGPSLSIRPTGDGQFELLWTADAPWILLQSDSIQGLYAPVPGNPASGLKISPGSGTQNFYQLRR